MHGLSRVFGLHPWSIAAFSRQLLVGSGKHQLLKGFLEILLGSNPFVGGTLISILIALANG